jgi:signal transduction histidine kinase
MKIRTRLTFWYATILMVSLLIMGFGTYREILEQQVRHKHHLHPQEHALNETAEMVLYISLPAILLGLVGGWWMTRKALAPVSALTTAVENLRENNLKGRLPRSNNGDELDRLTDVFNAMTARLDDSFQRIHEFTLHASHELKTPLTILRAELESALSNENLVPPQRDRVLSHLDEIERLTKIVDGLTLLTKADAGQIQLKCETVALHELVQDSLDDAKILAQSHHVQVNLAACDPAVIEGDRHRLRQLLLNLTDNAIKYNQPGGTVTMSLRNEAQESVLTIANTGPGISPELQRRVFERFFRGDANHNHNIEGCGLGLSLAQWIAHAHNTNITLTSTPNELTVVTVKFARQAAPAGKS